MFYLSHQCQMYHNFKYFEKHIEIMWGKNTSILSTFSYAWQEALIPIRIRQNDADLTRSGSTTPVLDKAGCASHQRQPLSHDIRVGQRAAQRQNYIK